ncbi:MAG: sialate O-acetylesterase [Planctomycetota bacterium]|nr:sialate O-acetylesterase [Planctomycetota bacterium]
MLRSRSLLAALTTLGLSFPLTAQKNAVKVFILAGQSNMEGKVQNPLFDHQATDEKTKALFAHLREDDQWIERDDVFIKFLKRHGPLTVGYGSPGRTGVELEFGTVMGEHFKAPVLLIKAAWGGHSLVQKFRPPSAGLPPAKQLDEELAKAQEQTRKRNEKDGRDRAMPTMQDIKDGYGISYRNMMQEVQTAMESCGELFGELEGKKLELTGFVWFQGWNDQYNGAEKEYEANMTRFIEDVRRDLDAPRLPFVIGVMGQNGSKPAKGAMKTIQAAQLAMPKLPAFRGNVLAVRTDTLVDQAAEDLYPTWKQNFEQWQLVGSDHPYHYLGSAIWHVRMGHAFAEAMLELLDNQ